MQNRTADRNVRRICHSRFDDIAHETARAFVMQQLDLRNLDWQATEAADTSGPTWISRPG